MWRVLSRYRLVLAVVLMTVALAGKFGASLAATPETGAGSPPPFYVCAGLASPEPLPLTGEPVPDGADCGAP